MKDEDDYLDLMDVIDPTAVWQKKKLRIIRTFEPHFNELLIELMSFGHTFAGACGRMGIPKSCGLTWANEYPDWAEAKEIGEQVRQYHLEMALNFQATGRIHPQDLEEWEEKNPDKPIPKGDLRAIMFSLKTVHKDDYSEKTIHEEVDTTTDADKGKGNLNDELSKQLDTLRRSLIPGTNRRTEKKSVKPAVEKKEFNR